MLKSEVFSLPVILKNKVDLGLTKKYFLLCQTTLPAGQQKEDKKLNEGMKRQNLDRKFIFTLLCGTCKTFQKDREMKILQLLFTLISIKNLIIG